MAKSTRSLVSTALRQAINDSGKSANEISSETGVAQPIISRFLSGERGLNLHSIDQLADYFGLELVPRLKQQK